MRLIKSYQGSTITEGTPLSEICEFNDNGSRVYDQEINTELSKLEIQSLIEVNSFWRILSTLIKDNMNLILRESNSLEMVYDVDNSNDLMIDFISKVYGIEFPPEYTLGQRRLILKYFPNFLKYKGIPQYSLKIINLIDREESELYQYPPDQFEVLPVSNGIYEIKLPPRITSIQFTMDLINRLTQEGMYYITNSTKNTKILGLLETGEASDKINSLTYNNSITYDSKTSLYDIPSTGVDGLLYDIRR